MARIAFLGLGAMGSRMTMTLIKAGHTLTVWNRMAERAKPLVEAGALLAAAPRDAVSEADFVITMLRDDEASKQVWLDASSGVLAAMPKSAIAIESSTLTIAFVQELAEQAQKRGIAFLDAPVAGSRPQAEAGQLIYMVGGARGDLERALPILNTIGGAVHHAGRNGDGAALKLAVNALFGIQVTALAELLGFLRANGIDPAKAMDIFGTMPVISTAAKGAAASMLAGSFAPMFPVDLVEKDFGYVSQGAASSAAQVPLSNAARAVFATAIKAGYGCEHLTAVARLYG